MSYLIECTKCTVKTKAYNIVDLIENYTDHKFGINGGNIKCCVCGHNAYIFRESNLQEGGEPWQRLIRGVIRIPSEVSTYHPYVFLYTEKNDETNVSIHFSYYKDTRSEPEGKLKHGHGPGGGPVFTPRELVSLIEMLIQFGYLSGIDVENILKGISNQTTDKRNKIV